MEEGVDKHNTGFQAKIINNLVESDNIDIDAIFEDSGGTLHDRNRIILHIMVIGFHHKHGYQVDYCYPPLTPDGQIFSTSQRPITLPPSWKTLPLLCLPDGSHNYDSDAIYFTMPDIADRTKDEHSPEAETDKTIDRIEDGIKTIYGTACYRQIHVEKLLHRTDDMTRVAVQKSVCVLSTQPLFGLIRSKLEMITHAYFEELDFSKVNILKLTYNNLNSLLSRKSVRENSVFLGLSTRQLVSCFGNNLLVLYKAMLLEKKILFYRSPVKDLCSTILSICSLFNGLIECGGLDYSTCDLQLSPSLLEALKLEHTTVQDDESVDRNRGGSVAFSSAKGEVTIIDGRGHDRTSSSKNETIAATNLETCSAAKNEQESTTDIDANISPIDKPSTSADTSEFEMIETSFDETIVEDSHAHKLCRMSPQECGFPLQIFNHGSFCLPYLSISYLDLLSDTRVRSFVIGATNFLFKQRRSMFDIVVDMEDNTIIINDPQLKRLLGLSVEDLRFLDYLAKNVKTDPSQSDPLAIGDVTSWIGGDEWIRYHFKIYTLYLLKAARQHNLDANQAMSPDVCRFVETFNSSFVAAWKSTTHNYRAWQSTNKTSMLDGLQMRHPFSSLAKGINFGDMKLKISHAVNNSERGRLVSQTLNDIGKWSIWGNLVSVGNVTASTIANSAASAQAAIATTINPTNSSESKDNVRKLN